MSLLTRGIGTALLLVGAGFLGGCSINVNADEYDHDGHGKPRTATDQCRREIDRSFGDRYKIAFDLPDLTTNANVQTVVQPFTLASRRDSFEPPQQRVLRCTIVDSALTMAVPG